MKLISAASAIIAAALVLTPLSSSPAEMNYYPENRILKIEGEIVSGDTEKMVKIIDEFPVSLVLLDSYGGIATVGLWMGFYLHSSGINTGVQKADCISACAFIWMAGRNKYISKGSRVAFHAPRHMKTNETNVRINLLVSYMTGLYGLSPKMAYDISQAWQPTGNDLIYLNRFVATRWGLLQTTEPIKLDKLTEK
jgi:hypothetical protein